MIYNQSIQSKDINIKKFLKYSDNYTLIPIKYKNNDLIIQTPKMYIPYGEKFVYNNNDKKYVDISFQNIENDKNIELFYHNLDIIHSKINKVFDGYNVDDLIKIYNKNELLRLKINKGILIYDHNQNIIDKIIPNTYGYFIIHLHGLWVNKNNNNIYYHWVLLQSKLDIPLYLTEYSFIDDTPQISKGKGMGKGKSIPPPPPPSLILPKPLTKYDRMIKMGVPIHAVQNKIQNDKKINAADLQSITLKKTIINDKKKESDDIPYLIELISKINRYKV
jgi:hypothetical protein